MLFGRMNSIIGRNAWFLCSLHYKRSMSDMFTERLSFQQFVFRLDALALSVIATATWLAGWVAGWVAVTLRYCIKTAKPIGKLFRPSESPITLVF